MSKKIFCDVCGDEMDYAHVPEYLKGYGTTVTVKGHGNITHKFEVAVKIQPAESPNGAHIDVCSCCRSYLLDLLDNRTDEQREDSRADVDAALG